MTEQHRKQDGDSPFPDDLERDPGIGESKGAFATGEDPEEIESEGDVENDAGIGGGADPEQLGRTNK